MARHKIAVLLCIALGTARAQTPGVPGDPQPQADIPTLGEVRALALEEETPVDLYRFRNPVQVEPNRFDRAYRPPPSVKQVSEGGGYVMMGLYYGVAAIAKGVHRLTGGRDEIQAAIARPPPLNEAQMQRAAAMCDSDGRPCDGQAQEGAN